MTGISDNTAVELQQVGRLFRITAPFFGYENVTQGNVNVTRRVDYVEDDGSGFARIKSYLFQRVSSVAFRDPDALMQNIDMVTQHLRQKSTDGSWLHFHHTENGANYIMIDGNCWRVRNWVDSVTFDKCDDMNVLRSTGEAFGEFQMKLADFDVNRLHYTIKDFHNTNMRYEALKAAVKADKCGRAASVAEEINWLLEQEKAACKLTDMEKQGLLPLRVTHNDTKINNVLFDRETLRPMFVIDLDTVMPGLVGHDFGDAIRFAANFTEEDSEDTSKTGLDLNAFNAFSEGFLSKVAATLTENEIKTLADSCFSITCELAARFLTDYLEGDKYFAVKKPGHNLIRTRCQIALAKDMLNKRHAMQAICEECCVRYRG